jgi:hypothetical protein
VACVAHVTNTMATHGDDFDNGKHDGTNRILSVAAAIARAWAANTRSVPKTVRRARDGTRIPADPPDP